MTSLEFSGGAPVTRRVREPSVGTAVQPSMSFVAMGGPEPARRGGRGGAFEGGWWGYPRRFESPDVKVRGVTGVFFHSGGCFGADLAFGAG
jgi:hypothetical protein